MKPILSVGLLLLIGGVLAAIGVGLYSVLFDQGSPFHTKVIVGAIYGGLILLLLSVLWQRLVERRTDKYKDVNI